MVYVVIRSDILASPISFVDMLWWNNSLSKGPLPVKSTKMDENQKVKKLNQKSSGGSRSGQVFCCNSNEMEITEALPAFLNAVL